MSDLTLSSGTPRKQRTINWTPTEVEVLIEEVQNNYNLLFGHFSSTSTQSQKKKVWAGIVQKINSNSRTLRDIPQAKKKWADLKSLTRKKAALQNKERKKTGGGVSEEIVDLSSIENKIISIIPTCQVSGVTGGLESEASELPGPDIIEQPTNADDMAMVVSCPPPSPVAGPSTATDSVTSFTCDRPTEVPIMTQKEVKRAKSNATTRNGDSYSREILQVEREKLLIQGELLATQKERLSVEKERLVVEREILHYLQNHNQDDIFLSPVIKF